MQPPENLSIRQCSRCLLDLSDDPAITFNSLGICSHCTSYDEAILAFEKAHPDRQRSLDAIVKKIKNAGQGKKFDCIVGLSGGVDSTYLALKARELGLRVLAVHFDNGWNSELAVHNIERIVTKLGFTLHTFPVDWQEFKDIQLAFLKASVVDIEIVTDHAIITELYKLAIEYNVKYILSGTNMVTEYILPSSWIHNKKDHVHIKGVHKIFGTVPIKTYPLFTSFLKWRVVWNDIKSVSLLDYMPYDKQVVKSIISKELGWRDYGGKHYESIFTRFFQGYILPVKFNIDKRKAHLSNLICSKQITKQEALTELAKPIYPEETKRSDYQFVLKKLGLTEKQFEEILKLPIRKHSEYPVESDIYKRFPLLRLVKLPWYFIKVLRNQKPNG